jgi:hypothetical protein
MTTCVCLILNCHKSILPVKWYQAVRIAQEVQTLRTCTTMLHHTYIACLVVWKYTRGKGFQVQIVTEDEIWIPCFEPESKQQLMEWCHITAQKRKFKVVPSAGKSWLQFRWECWTITTDWRPSVHLCQVCPIRKWKSYSSVTNPDINAYTHAQTHMHTNLSTHEDIKQFG